MGAERAIVDYVCSSTVRTTVLRALADEPRTTDGMLTTVEASESAVYDALAGLEERGLVQRAARRTWQPTGAGRAVLSVIEIRDRTEDLLGTDPEYWRDHDIDALPWRFQARLHELAGAEVVRATDTDPHQVVRLVSESIEEAQDLVVIAPVYHERYEAALRKAAPRINPRLVADATAVRDRVAGTLTDEPAEIEAVEARVAEVDIGLAVTDRQLFLSLPTLDGDYEARAEVVAESAEALVWGRNLFEHHWERATPAAEYLDGQPDLLLE